MDRRALAAALVLVTMAGAVSIPASAQNWRDIVGGFTANRTDSRNFYDARDRLDRVQARLHRALDSRLIGQKRFVQLSNRLQDVRAQMMRNRGWSNRNGMMNELSSIEDSLRTSIANRQGPNWY